MSSFPNRVTNKKRGGGTSARKHRMTAGADAAPRFEEPRIDHVDRGDKEMNDDNNTDYYYFGVLQRSAPWVSALIANNIRERQMSSSMPATCLELGSCRGRMLLGRSRDIWYSGNTYTSTYLLYVLTQLASDSGLGGVLEYTQPDTILHATPSDLSGGRQA